MDLWSFFEKRTKYLKNFFSLELGLYLLEPGRGKYSPEIVALEKLGLKINPTDPFHVALIVDRLKDEIEKELKERNLWKLIQR